LKHCFFRLIIADIYLCTYHEINEATIAKVIDGALDAKGKWESLLWNDRAAIFLKAADIVSEKCRYKFLVATILGQGKNVWQSEIDAAAEVKSFSLSLPFLSSFITRLTFWAIMGNLVG
jgi:acyl-CoA reductase-like NAD-dependent aldehyde dehydrogenase